MPLVKLTKEEVNSLPAGDHTGPYYVKLIRLFDPAPVVVWEGHSTLYVQRAPAYRKRPERLACITPRAYVWAEGGYEDVEDDGSILVEDYEMEIYREE